MEVVIDGELVRSSSGEGFRAFALSANGRIAEHATLMDASNLANTVNAAAVWQIASVVVAQKHLADISQKLGEVIRSVDEIQKYMHAERRARIVATHMYLQQATESISGGELSVALRMELESCERSLLEIQEHLFLEYQQKSSERILATETFGTEQLTKDLVLRYEALESLVKDISLCLKTRVLAWHVLALYPGEPQLKLARQSDILRSIDKFDSLKQLLKDALATDLPKITAIFNSQKTLDERCGRVRDRSTIVEMLLESSRSTSRDHAKNVEQLLLAHDRPMSLMCELNNLQLSGLRSMEVVV